jgi:serine/threonine protein kinase
MARSNGTATPAGQERSLTLLLRESGDALEASAPPFDVTLGAARLREAARASGFLQPGNMAEAMGAALEGLEERAPAFDVEAGAAQLREAALARGLLSGSALQRSEDVASWIRRPDREISRRGAAATSVQQVLQSRYRLLHQLGAGGMGSVWEAEDLQLQRTVALKELVPHGASAGLTERQGRALQEARAIARVRHPAIVSIHDVFFVGDDLWIVMDYISGRSLEAILREERQLDERVIAAIGLQVLRGLSAAHRAGVVHRDVKPANILVTADASVVLVDFGIAQITGDVTLTGPQTVLGTLEFLAPERLHGNAAGPAADLWSLGVTLFYALEGYSPFRREPAREAIVRAILHDDPPRPARQGRLADVILRMLAKDPARRAGVNELADTLQAIAAQAKPSDPELKAPPQSSADRRPRPTGAQLTGQSFQDIREVTQKVSADTAVATLLAMPEDQAGHLLASYSPEDGGELLQGIAAARPGTAGKILRGLRTADAARLLASLRPDAAAAVLTTMKTEEAAQILSRTKAQMAASIITQLPAAVSAAIIMRMETRRTAEILTYVNPVTVASLLRSASNSVTAAVLGRLEPAFRAQVAQSLPRED